jgi:hypothetical protein
MISTFSLGNDILLDIKKNGASILEGRVLSIEESTFIGNILTFTEIPVNTTDYITVDIKQVGSAVAGSDLSIRLIYNLY